MPLRRFDRVSHSLIAGVDYKRTNNNLEFGLTNVSATKADILQGVASYDLRGADAWGTTAMTASVFFSPGGLTDNNKDANFQALRAFAESRYAYANLQMRRITRLPHELTWHVSAQVQIADGNLLGSEQLGAGGYTSVRGYDELEATGDEGFIVRNEIHTPAFVFDTPLPGKRSQLELLAFVDYGQVHNKHLLPGEARRVEMASTGVGARFAVDQNVSFRFDYGRQLHDDGVPGGRKNGRPHFALLVSF
jgi:hemolysin activation/secretion protein